MSPTTGEFSLSSEEEEGEAETRTPDKTPKFEREHPRLGLDCLDPRRNTSVDELMPTSQIGRWLDDPNGPSAFEMLKDGDANLGVVESEMPHLLRGSPPTG